MITLHCECGADVKVPSDSTPQGGQAVACPECGRTLYFSESQPLYRGPSYRRKPIDVPSADAPETWPPAAPSQTPPSPTPMGQTPPGHTPAKTSSPPPTPTPSTPGSTHSGYAATPPSGSPPRQRVTTGPEIRSSAPRPLNAGPMTWKDLMGPDHAPTDTDAGAVLSPATARTKTHPIHPMPMMPLGILMLLTIIIPWSGGIKETFNEHWAMSWDVLVTAEMPLRILVGGLWMVGLSTMICALVGRWYHVTPMWLFLGFCGMGLLIGCGLGQMVLHKAPVSQYENFGRGLLMLLLLLGTLIATSVRLRAGFHRQLALAQFLFGGGLIATLVWNVYPRLRSGDPMKAWPNTFGMTMEIDIPALIILGGGVSLAVLLAVIHGMGIARHDRSLSRISQVAMVIGLFGTVGYLYVRVSAAAGGTADVVLPLINGLLLLLPTLAIYTVGLTRSWHEVLAQDPAIYIAKKTARH